MSFHVGQKVVCVDADDRDFGLIGAPAPINSSPWHLEERAVYVVRWVGPWQVFRLGRYWGDPFIGVRLAGITRRLGRDTPFDARRFRPIVEKKTDIAIFTDILDRENRKTKIPDHQNVRVPNASG